MPTVLRVRGFRVLMFGPPREHGPPHVHVRNAGAEVVIELASPERPAVVRRVVHMRNSDIATARRIVNDHAPYLLMRWRALHA